MSLKNLEIDTITFGKYKGYKMDKLLQDRKYCEWLLCQDWFQNNYEFLYNQIKNYNPSEYFIKQNIESKEDPLKTYKYFNLVPLEELKIELNQEEKVCYKFYLSLIKDIKDKIIYNENINPFDIKAPKSWLNTLETKHNISRETFKTFLSSYDLPNITKIVEDIKSFGGIEYKGNKSYKIAKEKSKIQEIFWEEILKDKYKDKIGTQFKFNNCFFDFINISTNTLYECKLGLKDFNEKQFIKYKKTLEHYKMIYLISDDCIIDLSTEKIFTTNSQKYKEKIDKLIQKESRNSFENKIISFPITKIDNLQNFI
jgi:hypothetical protein